MHTRTQRLGTYLQAAVKLNESVLVFDSRAALGGLLKNPKFSAYGVVYTFTSSQPGVFYYREEEGIISRNVCTHLWLLMLLILVYRIDMGNSCIPVCWYIFVKDK